MPTLSGNFLDNFDPSLGIVYSQFPDSDKEDIDQAVKSALRAFPGWASTTLQERSRLLLKIADLMEDQSEELSQAESLDQGKPVHLAKSMDIPRAISCFRLFAGAILNEQEYSCHTDHNIINYGARKPLGVVGLITPWNLPLYLLSWKMAPALASGNCVVCKPSELTPLTAFLMGDILTKAGLPHGVCNIIFGLGHKAGEALITHPDISAISFTGGTQTGRHIAQITAGSFKKLSLELGGKNPNIIFSNANLDLALEQTLRSSFLNQGEICLCGSRIFVEQKIYKEFLSQFCKKTEELKVGDPKDPNTFLGPLISKNHLEKVLSFIEQARLEGGHIEVGGTSPHFKSDGYYLRPTIITGLHCNSKIMQDEIFGPVVTVTPFDTEDSVIKMANSVKYGLSASIWTQNISQAHRIAHKLDVGTVWINSWMIRDLRVPFGGMKASGVGREGGYHSLHFFTEQKNICLKF